LTIGLTGGKVGATHNPDLSWMNQYKDEKGYGCCGIYDCVEVDAKVVSQGPGFVIVDVDGVVMKLPQAKGEYLGKTHFHSNDNTDYWCFSYTALNDGTGAASVGGQPSPAIKKENTRCVFISFGG
jgi:hypothetical protein